MLGKGKDKHFHDINVCIRRISVNISSIKSCIYSKCLLPVPIFIIYHKTYSVESGFEIIRKHKNIRNKLNYIKLRHILSICSVD